MFPGHNSYCCKSLYYGTASIHLQNYFHLNNVFVFFGRNDVEGGVSIMQDVVPVISELRTNYPQHFSTLTEVPATFHRFRTQR